MDLNVTRQDVKHAELRLVTLRMPLALLDQVRAWSASAGNDHVAGLVPSINRSCCELIRRGLMVPSAKASRGRKRP